ncbi:MAG: NUDIX hydrolase [Planctomycetales bacterium]|nr:NUDIX hydrolase [Planctomycetales bacterium]
MGRWEFATRTSASAAVAVVPVTSDRELILVEQFRIPVGKPVIEFPAGLVGDDGQAEDLAAAARRELEEETGYRAGAMTLAESGPSSAGLADEVVSIFLARDLTAVSTGGGVDGEEIVVHVVPLAEIDAWLAAQQRRGCLVDNRVFAGLYLLARAERNETTG